MNDTKRRLNTLAHRLGRRLPVPVKLALRKLLRRAEKPPKSRMAPTLSVVLAADVASLTIPPSGSTGSSQESQ
jgi:hypothetical protein